MKNRIVDDVPATAASGEFERAPTRATQARLSAFVRQAAPENNDTRPPPTNEAPPGPDTNRSGQSPKRSPVPGREATMSGEAAIAPADSWHTENAWDAEPSAATSSTTPPAASGPRLASPAQTLRAAPETLRLATRGARGTDRPDTDEPISFVTPPQPAPMFGGFRVVGRDTTLIVPPLLSPTGTVPASGRRARTPAPAPAPAGRERTGRASAAAPVISSPVHTQIGRAHV